MKRRSWTTVIIIAGIAGFAAWAVSSRYDATFAIPRLHKPLVDGLPNTLAAPQFRNEALMRSGALCGEIRGVEGGERFITSGAPRAEQRLVPIAADTWRRFIVVPSQPGFYVEGLAPWGLSLDHKRIVLDALDIDAITENYQWQYARARIDAGRDADAVAREIHSKVLRESFEVEWSEQCNRPA